MADDLVTADSETLQYLWLINQSAVSFGHILIAHLIAVHLNAGVILVVTV